MLAFFKKLIYAAVLGALVLFAIQNLEALSQTIFFKVDLFKEGWQYTTPHFPVVILFIVFFILGLLGAGSHGLIERLSIKSELRSRNKQLKKLEAEVADFRAQEAKLEPPAPAKPVAGTERPSTTIISTPESTTRPTPLEDEPTL